MSWAALKTMRSRGPYAGLGDADGSDALEGSGVAEGWGPVEGWGPAGVPGRARPSPGSVPVLPPVTGPVIAAVSLLRAAGVRAVGRRRYGRRGSRCRPPSPVPDAGRAPRAARPGAAGR